MTTDLLERDLQAKCVDWWNQSGLPGLLFHVPNEGKRGRLEAAALGAMGVMSGVPDFILLLPNGRVHLIELKTPMGSWGQRQQEFARLAQQLGHTYSIVRSTEEFRGSILAAMDFWTFGAVVDFFPQVPLP